MAEIQPKELPKISSRHTLGAERKKLYNGYKEEREEMNALKTAKRNADIILGKTQHQIEIVSTGTPYNTLFLRILQRRKPQKQTPTGGLKGRRFIASPFGGLGLFPQQAARVYTGALLARESV